MDSRYHEIMATKPFLPLRMGYLTDWMIKDAERELNETEESRSQALEEFRNLIAQDTKLTCWTDDAYLLQFLRTMKFNVKKAMGRLQQFYTVKKNYPDVYPANLDLGKIKNIFATGAASYLPYRDANGCPILIFKLSKWDPNLYHLSFGISVMTATILNAVEDPATQVCGIQIIFDVEGTSLKQMRQMTPRYIQLLSCAITNTLPVRFKGIHIFNESAIFSYTYNILKLFYSEKIKKRVHLHGSNAKRLHKYIPKEILPAEYGGKNTNYNAKELGEKEMELFYETYLRMHQNGYL